MGLGPRGRWAQAGRLTLEAPGVPSLHPLLPLSVDLVKKLHQAVPGAVPALRQVPAGRPPPDVEGLPDPRGLPRHLPAVAPPPGPGGRAAPPASVKRRVRQGRASGETGCTSACTWGAGAPSELSPQTLRGVSVHARGRSGATPGPVLRVPCRPRAHTRVVLGALLCDLLL